MNTISSLLFFVKHFLYFRYLAVFLASILLKMNIPVFLSKTNGHKKEPSGWIAPDNAGKSVPALSLFYKKRHPDGWPEDRMRDSIMTWPKHGWGIRLWHDRNMDEGFDCQFAFANCMVLTSVCTGQSNSPPDCLDLDGFESFLILCQQKNRCKSSGFFVGSIELDVYFRLTFRCVENGENLERQRFFPFIGHKKSPISCLY